MTEANINEKYDNDSMSFRLKGICQSSYKITGKTEEEAPDIAFTNDSQDATVTLAITLFPAIQVQSECWDIRKSSQSIKSQNILSQVQSRD